MRRSRSLKIIANIIRNEKLTPLTSLTSSTSSTSSVAFDSEGMHSLGNIIDGKSIAATITDSLKSRLKDLSVIHPTKTPGLAVVLVGDKKDSGTYVRMKGRAAEHIGINFDLRKFDVETPEQVVLDTIDALNKDETIHGIIVQLPLPPQISKYKIIEHINPAKDVDGFHPLGFGKLAMEGFDPLFSPCTPRGVMELLKQTKINFKGKHVVVLGKSNIVGLPMSLMLLQHDATVTVCNAHTLREEEITRDADILISAVGKPKLVKEDWIKEGAIVIDIGINSIPDNTKKRGYRLVGDVDFDNVRSKASYITPVPGGVGPMTVAMLMKATIESYERSILNKS